MSKHILIIGGMGPQASVHAHKRLLEQFVERMPYADNSSFPRITHLSINVDDFISDSTKQDAAKRYILDCLEDINLESVDKAFIACNTAHLLYDNIKVLLGDKLTSMIGVAAESIQNTETGIIATPSTLRTNLYSEHLIKPSRESSANIEGVIRSIIAGANPSELAEQIESEVRLLRDNGAQKVILGCTELSIIGSFLGSEYIIDPIELTVTAILEQLYGATE